jgi:hypothetical protein
MAVTRSRQKSKKKQILLDFFNSHNSHYAYVNDARVLSIKSAMALTEDTGVIEPNQLLVGVLIAQFKVLLKGIESLDKVIKKAYKAQDDKVIFDSFSGAGPQLAPRLLVAFSSNRDRYNDPSELQKYAGIAPVIERSGKKVWTHWRYSCPTFLRQTFVEWAGFRYVIHFGQRLIMSNKKVKVNHIIT